ncbi:MFS transporter [Paracoccaceae bacterium]|nr:MFS transporter [Paracoccaceae bacterium]
MDIDKATLGFALIGLPLGVQITLLFADRIVRRFNFRLVLMMGIPLLSISQVLATLSESAYTFAGILMLGGAAIAVIEVAVNLEADRVEAHIGHRIMNRSHAYWSFGFFGAGIVGAGFSQLGISPFSHFALITVLSSVLTILLFAKYDAAKARRQSVAEKNKGFVWPSRGIFLLVFFSLSAMLVEGASIDWSVIFMRDIFNTVPIVSGLSLALAAIAQGIIRYFADQFVDKYGPERVSFYSLIAMVLGVGCVVFSFEPITALLGFLLMGGGSAVIFPLAMSAAAQRTDKTPEENVASLAQFVFVIFLLAPPILGFVAEYAGLRWSFALCFPLLIVSFFTIHSLNVQKDEKKNAY